MKNGDDIKCDRCGFETKIWMAIDNWAIHNKQHICRKCQKEMKIGWYADNITRRPPDDIIFA